MARGGLRAHAALGAVARAPVRAVTERPQPRAPTPAEGDGATARVDLAAILVAQHKRPPHDERAVPVRSDLGALIVHPHTASVWSAAHSTSPRSPRARAISRCVAGAGRSRM